MPRSTTISVGSSLPVRRTSRILPVGALALFAPLMAEFVLGDQYLSGRVDAGQQVGEVDAAPYDGHAEVRALERDDELGLPDGVRDGRQDRDGH